MNKFSFVRYSAVCGLVIGLWRVVILLLSYFAPDIATKVIVPYMEDIVVVVLLFFFLNCFKRYFCFETFTMAKGLKVGLAMSFFAGVVIALGMYHVMSDAEYVASLLAKEQEFLMQNGYNLTQGEMGKIEDLYLPLNSSLMSLGSMMFLGLAVSAVSMAFLKDR